MKTQQVRRAIMVLAALMALVVLAGCQRERPAPTPVPSAGATPGTALPARPSPAGVTQPAAQAPSVQSGGSQTGAAGAAGSGSSSTQSSPSQPQGQVDASGNMRHTVQAGDTLGQIAQRYGVSTSAIVAVNPLANPDILLVGQELLIPTGSSGSAGGGSVAGGQTSSASTAAEGGSSGAYVVQYGDSLTAIANRYGVSLVSLMQANGISNADQIEVGRTLQIPGASDDSAGEGAAGSTTYIVQPGDTLFTIAVGHGVTAAALQQANGIANENQIYVGQVLTIP